MPSHVAVDGTLLPLRDWQHKQVRDLCLGHLFGRTRAQFTLLGLVSRHFGVPSPDCVT